MYVKVLCPHCTKVLKVKEEYLGQRTRCPYCRETFELTASISEDPSESRAGVTVETPGETSGTGPFGKTEGTNVSLILTAVIGMGVTAAFYGLLVLPLWKTKFGQFFWDRGWVQYCIILLGAWAASMLAFKMQKLAKQRGSLLFDALPTELSRVIRPDNARTFQRHIRALPHSHQESILLNRVYKALANFRARGSIQETTTLLASQAEIDASAVQSSYTIVKVFIWAIPILGFIGTVIGIGHAVGGFSQALDTVQELDKIKGALGGVTSGLATAFDTTLLALIVSLLVMFPASSIEKAEEDLLIAVEEYCNENLLSRMQELAVAKEGDSTQIKQVVSEAMKEHDADLHQRLKHLKVIGRTVTEQVAEGWETIHRQLQEDKNATVHQFTEILNAVSEERRSFVGQVKAVQEEQLTRFRDAIASLSKTAADVQQQITASQDKQVRSFNDVVSMLSGNLKSLQEQGSQRCQAEQEALREMAARLARTLDDVKDKTIAVQASMTESLHVGASNQQAAMQRIDAMIASLAQQTQALRAKMVEAESSRHAAFDGMMHAVQADREAAARSTSEQLKEVSRVGSEIVSSISDCQQRFSADIGKLADAQQKVALYFERLAKSDSFSRKLFGIEEGLTRLASGLKDMDARIQANQVTHEAPDDQHDGRRRGLWSRFTRRDDHA
ncbi:MAG: MotA/TolQ/ExbB proton channel family protein [Sedimentisphaerales bacterium]|nr:MotA/TolQ/ExbB proton channel family protein [Sedimentisphaerales bacterium]